MNEIIKHLSNNVLKNPDKIAFQQWSKSNGILSCQKWTWKEVDEESDLVANFLQKLGINEHDKVGIYSYNSIYYILYFFAIFKLNAIAIPLNINYNNNDISTILKKINFKILFCNSKTEQRNITSAKNSLKTKLMCDYKKNKQNQTNILKQKKPGNWKTAAETDTVLMICSSGSTGKPKIIIHNNKTLSAMVKKVSKLFANNNDTVLNKFPYYHIAGLDHTLGTIKFGCLQIICEKNLSWLDLLQIICSQSVTYVCLPLPIYKKIIQEKKNNSVNFSHYNIDKNKTKFITGGQALDSSFISDWLKYFSSYKFIDVYGSSEIAGSVLCTTLKKGSEFHLTYDVISVDNIKINGNSFGELLIKDAGLSPGYYKDNNLTKLKYDNGWYKTGDIVSVNKDKSVNIIGRTDDVIISGGENVYPLEVENFIKSKIDIKDAIVVPINDAIYGQRVALLLVCFKDKRLDNDDLQKALLELPIHKRPAKVKLITDIRDEIGKLNRNDLTKKYFNQ